MENVRRYRALAALCRQQAAFDPDNGRRWLARADRWESLAEAEIQDRFRQCNEQVA